MAALVFPELRPAITTSAPASASPRAIPRPMPPLPPVTIATLPCKSNSFMAGMVEECPIMDGSEPSRSTILKSNVEGAEPARVAAPPERRRFPWARLLGGVILVVVGVGAGLILASSQQRPQPAASVATPPAPAAAAATTSRTRPAAAPTAAVSSPLPDINGISCDALESTIEHIHVHLAIFFNGEEQQIPFGIGIGQPWQVTSSGSGPFVSDGACFYWIHTHTEDGVVHIESPVRRRFTLGDFFAIWQVPLSGTQVGNAQGQVITYINGQRNATNPPDLPLLPHARIQLCVGGDV